MFANFVFNETAPSSAATAASSNPVMGAQDSLPGGVAGPLDDWQGMMVIAEITGNTGGTLNVYLQTSPDAGNTWYDAIAFKQAAGGGAVAYYSAPMSLADATTAPTQVGKNLVPALSAGTNGTVVNGSWGDRARLVMVSGSGTSAGGSVVVRLCPVRGRERLA